MLMLLMICPAHVCTCTYPELPCSRVIPQPLLGCDCVITSYLYPFLCPCVKPALSLLTPPATAFAFTNYLSLYFVCSVDLQARAQMLLGKALLADASSVDLKANPNM